MRQAILITGMMLSPFIAYFVSMGLLVKWRYRHFSTRARRVEARIQGVRRGDVGGDDPYVYYVIVWRWQHPDTHELHFFKSNDLEDDPTPYIDRYKVVHVLVDPEHPDRYQIDEPGLARLKARLANEHSREERVRERRRRTPPSEEELDEMTKQIFEARGAGKAYERYLERSRNASSDEELDETERKLRAIQAPRARAQGSGAKPR